MGHVWWAGTSCSGLAVCGYEECGGLNACVAYCGCALQATHPTANAHPIPPPAPKLGSPPPGCGEAPEALEMAAKLMLPGEVARVTAYSSRQGSGLGPLIIFRAA
jgi:hypothetical protein